MSTRDDAPMTPSALVDYAKSLDCIHCGLCLNSCPTYRLTGAESSSPRGRIHLMRAVAEQELAPDAAFVDEMDFCLLCRNCESVCPSGVHFGAMMEHTRDALVKSGRSKPRGLVRFAFDHVLRKRWMLRLATRAGRTLQLMGTWRIFFTHLGKHGRLLADVPDIPPARERRRMPALTKAACDRRGAVAMLEGCVMPELYGRVNRAAASVLSRSGFDVQVPRDHVCCGSLHAHNGDLDGARALARSTIAAFEPLVDEHGAPAPVVVDSAGCGAHMKEYAHLFASDDPWHGRAKAFSARVKDFSEFLAAPLARDGLVRALRTDAPGQALGRVTYDDPCHLCHAQGVRKPPRELLDLVPGLERVELPYSEQCCGSAGIYSMLRPADSLAIFAPKVAALDETGARVLVTANPGCHLQWDTGLARERRDVRVMPLAEVLELATRPDGRVTASRPASGGA
ncbi:MAG: (Fe-S)-binding protein [Planctomycetes bacterium]|nr:(Fe-S)-binding protein [Planctomycetota bacterium]